MRDALIFAALALLMFPVGAAFVHLARLLAHQRSVPEERGAGGRAWFIVAIPGVGCNLALAALYACAHNWELAQEKLIIASLFISMACGAWAEARRLRKAR